ncbi:MAG: thiamine monophosphate synthase [Sulfuricurvum sp. MLSB]|uniref:thiamine phosphate synthase n=1 Tax=unclassified Sulfuricurvum TaxID=2632390 RepID=UPI000504AB69|nr:MULTISPECIES: thiamine phosphate synthase [unclassified Sulfuricurvum]KFN38934.1 MAG: thiamine monophosphate synthase [Sulfuricurvum sp. MLSB]
MRLYALCDADTLRERGLDLSLFVNRANALGAEVIQYRNKHADIAAVKADLITLRRLWDGFLIINDHYELAPFCDGVHIGQEDLYAIHGDPFKALKILKLSVGSDKIIGLSTHNEREIAIANELDLNYVGLGAYRATSTKAEAKVLGKKLDAIAALSKHPVAAIGGVKLDDTFQHVTYHVIGSGLISNENAK